MIFDSFGTPEVLHGEMALEATCELFGHKTQLRDVEMTFLLVFPDCSEPEPTMRFVLKSITCFEIQSTNASGKTTTHVEASLDPGRA